MSCGAIAGAVFLAVLAFNVVLALAIARASAQRERASAFFASQSEPPSSEVGDAKQNREPLGRGRGQHDRE